MRMVEDIILFFFFARVYEMKLVAFERVGYTTLRDCKGIMDKPQI